MVADAEKPLAGKKIVVTRPLDQADRLATLLEELGAQVIEFPTIEILPVKRLPEIGSLDRYHWILFTSRNAVRYFSEALPRLGVEADYDGVKVGVVGPGTEAAAAARSIPVRLVAEEHVAEGLLAALEEAEPDLNGKRILIPGGNLARDLLPDSLRALGADVSVAVFYETVMPDVSEEEAGRMIAARPDAVTFTSASTARNFAKLVGADGLDALMRSHTVFVSIGPQTTEAARKSGIYVGITCESHDLPALVEVLVRQSKRMQSN